VAEQLKEGDIVLVKGSQNLVYAEEATKLLLADKKDAAKLVRQSDKWLRTKQQQFQK
jgi:phosphoenolpyruvate synthase/pyruvate phosphate dikinase